MKNLILAIATTTTVLFTSCNNNQKDDSSSTEMHDETLYACSMDPEIIGKKGESCSKCGMDLTEPVKDMDHMNHSDSSKTKIQ